MNDRFYNKIKKRAEEIDKLPIEKDSQKEHRQREERKLLAEISNIVPMQRGRKAAVIQTIGQLLNVKTLSRNLINNRLVYDAEHLTTNTIGRLFDNIANFDKWGTGLRSTVRTKRT